MRAAVAVTVPALLLAGCWSGPTLTWTVPVPVLVLALPQGPPGHPLQDAACRRAVFAAVDRVAVAASLDPSTSTWQPAFSLSPPGLDSYDADYRQFPDGQGRGEVASAREDLAACGHPDGFTMTLGFGSGVAGLGSPAEVDGLLTALTASLARVGIDGVVVEHPTKNESNPPDASQPDAVLVVLQAQAPGVNAFFDPLVHQGIAGDLGVAALDPLLAQGSVTDPGIDPGIERERGRMIDRLILSTLRYLPLATKPGPDEPLPVQ